VLHVALDKIEPEIWRRLIVPADITLDLLHDVLQVAMGWEDCHLHVFEIGGRRFTEDPQEPEEGENEGGVVLGALVTRSRTKFTYRYDYGDDWCHTIRVQEIQPIPEWDTGEIICSGGERRCPPEDVGGPLGYAEYLAALADPQHEEHESMLEWRGPFDPEEFDANVVNVELAKLIRWSRPRNR
jgi:hypothetical protein